MCNLARLVQAVNSLEMYSANKHLLIVLLARQEAGEVDWPGYEALSLDASIPQGLVEKACAHLRQKGLLRIFRAVGMGVHQFKIPVRLLERLAFEKR